MISQRSTNDITKSNQIYNKNRIKNITNSQSMISNNCIEIHVLHNLVNNITKLKLVMPQNRINDITNNKIALFFQC